MTPAVKKLIELLEEISIPLATCAQSWEIATRIRATIAEVRAEETVAPQIPPAQSDAADYVAFEPFVVCNDGLIRDSTGAVLQRWQKHIVVDRANALIGVRNPAAVKELIADMREMAKRSHGCKTYNVKSWVANFDKEPGNES